jgi:hypothetical protein
MTWRKSCKELFFISVLIRSKCKLKTQFPYNLTLAYTLSFTSKCTSESPSHIQGISVLSQRT